MTYLEVTFTASVQRVKESVKIPDLCLLISNYFAPRAYQRENSMLFDAHMKNFILQRTQIVKIRALI